MKQTLALALLLAVSCTNDLSLLSRSPDAGVSSDARVRDSSADSADVLDVRDAAFDAGFDGGDSGESDAGMASHGPLALGRSHACSIEEGALYCWGSDEDGQLGGLGQGHQPRRIEGGSGSAFVNIASRGRHTCALDVDGAVWCVGNNPLGQLGVGDYEVRVGLVQALLPPARSISCGNEGCCSLVGTSLYCWGLNREGAFGDPAAPSGDAGVPTPLQVTDIEWQAVATGNQHVIAIDLDGRLYSWGRNSSRQLGLGRGGETPTPTRLPDETRYRHVAAGQTTSCAISVDDELYCWGSGLALGQESDVDEPMFFAAGVSHVAVDTFHVCAIQDGTLSCWGRNQEGQLGTGDLEDRYEPTEVTTHSDWVDVSLGRFQTCARRSDASIWCTGVNTLGQAGIDPAEATRLRSFTRVADRMEK